MGKLALLVLTILSLMIGKQSSNGYVMASKFYGVSYCWNFYINLLVIIQRFMIESVKNLYGHKIMVPHFSITKLYLWGSKRLLRWKSFVLLQYPKLDGRGRCGPYYRRFTLMRILNIFDETCSRREIVFDRWWHCQHVC